MPSFSTSQSGSAGPDGTASRCRLEVCPEQVLAVLRILGLRQSEQTVEESAWRCLFNTVPYRLLKRREEELGIGFTDDEFRQFVLSPDLMAQAPSLRRAWRTWEKLDLRCAARRAFIRLPSQLSIRTRIFPVIKPRNNCFVYENESGSAVFLYLDPKFTRAQLTNTVAHELHHIGFFHLLQHHLTSLRTSSPAQAKVQRWLTAFGEGLAMLAAAPGPRMHPHAASKQKDRRRWDRDVAHFDRDLKVLDKFFLDILAGKLTPPDIERTGWGFYGVQGPWYTVGWKMAALVERRYGRARLVECMPDLRLLLSRYNAAALETHRPCEPVALWSSELMAALRT